MRKSRLLLSLIAILFGNLLFLSTSYANEIDKIIVFGDSLSDNGNIYSLSKKFHDKIHMIPLVPKKPPYYEGRFTNGQVWVEYLAQQFNVPLVDYAYGGSWAEPFRKSGLFFPFSLSSQVDMYAAANVTDYETDKHLYVFWTGANDYVHDRTDHEAATNSTVGSIRKNVEWLIYYYNIKNVLVIGLPDLSIAPEVIADGPEEVESLREITKMHNQKLFTMLDELRELYPDVTIVAGDPTNYTDDVLTNPAKYGFKNTSEACYGGAYWFRALNAFKNNAELEAAKKSRIDIMGSRDLRVAYMAGKISDQSPVDLTCADPDTYMFWDQLHPTTKVHRMISQRLFDKLQDNNIFSR